ncbi:classical arabinogalactan protein 27-like [Pyrus ussuriensis x Pyrus communis]|uniref:Classical arabinogalactan protein 27-like n=1 Tax=Pyrus ussuriensis x Pyrus communis TaxID=2448454 RepID=A0A5N5F941_9ROSA|nr:classical arabinogalactan protein 27-like [Pyrus ussuriensis x Pyrus communis]
MASFWLNVALMMALMATPLLSFNSKASSISASPTFFTNSPPSSNLQGLPPEIAPLLPSPGPEVPTTPTDSSKPTIPSNPSPLDLDDPPYPALSPFGSLPASSAASADLVWTLKVATFAFSAAYVALNYPILRHRLYKAEMFCVLVYSHHSPKTMSQQHS